MLDAIVVCAGIAKAVLAPCRGKLESRCKNLTSIQNVKGVVESQIRSESPLDKT